MKSGFEIPIAMPLEILLLGRACSSRIFVEGRSNKWGEG